MRLIGYKNLFLYTKMHNVSGIAQTEAQKSSDMFMKCRYLDEITNNRGTVFATGDILAEVLKAQELLKDDEIDIRVVDMYSIKPIDRELVNVLHELSI